MVIKGPNGRLAADRSGAAPADMPEPPAIPTVSATRPNKPCKP